MSTIPRLPHSFFERDVCETARDLVGCGLVWEGRRSVIVETEAYSAVGDEASHIFFRPSSRHFFETHPPGTAYVYLNYGVHWLLNVVARRPGGTVIAPENGMILIRALEPWAGQPCNGPGRLTRVLGVTGEAHGIDLCAPGSPGGFLPRVGEVAVECDQRVGITRSVELPWRFLLSGSPHLSIPKGKVRVPLRKSERQKRARAKNP